jgi:hypothetical protein
MLNIIMKKLNSNKQSHKSLECGKTFMYAISDYLLCACNAIESQKEGKLNKCETSKVSCKLN